MLHPNYPNLELLEYKTQQLLNQNKTFKEAIKKAKEEKGRFAYTSFEAIMFPQMWPNTCMGFDVMADGSPAIGGQAFTAAYTTVFHETLTDTYVVCFGNRPCYMIEHAAEAFYEDLRNHKMAALSEATARY